jgi:hypothetical protein
MTVAKPVPWDAAGGTSFPGLRLATNVIGVAEANGTANIIARTTATADSDAFISPSQKPKSQSSGDACFTEARR